MHHRPTPSALRPTPSTRSTFAVLGFILLVPICRLPARSPRTDAGGGEPIYTLAWKRLLGGPVPLPVVGSDGTIYIGSKTGDLYALRASDGHILWRYSTGTQVRVTPDRAGTQVFSGGGDGVFRALDRASGEVRWTFRTRGRISAGAAVSGDTTFFGSGDGMIYALRVGTGELVWKARVSAELLVPPIVLGQTVYAGTSDGTLWALAKETGFRRWTFETEGPIRSGLVARDTGLYFGSDDGYIYALAPEDGRLQWSYRVGAAVRFRARAGDDRIVFGAENRHLYALNIEDGKPGWKHRFESPLTGIDMTPDGLIWVGTEDGFLHRLDVRYGALQEILGPLSGGVRPLGSNGTMYLAGDDGHLYAMSPLQAYTPHPEALWETWFETFYAESKVGYAHEWAERARGSLRVHTEETNWDGGFQTVTSTVEVDTSWSLLSFDARRVEGDQVLRVQGRRVGEAVFLEVELAGYEVRDTVQVTDTAVPLEVLERALFARTRPLPGTTRRMKAFDIGSLTPEDVSITVGEPETLSIRDHSHQALRLTVHHDQEGLRDIEIREWVDPDGQILRAEMPELKVSSQIAPWRQAQTWTGGAGIRDTLKISIPIRSHEDVEDLEIEVQTRSGDAAELFVSDHRQQVHPEPDRAARIQIRREPSTVDIGYSTVDIRKLNSPGSLPAELRGYLRPTEYIQSDHPRIASLAERIRGDEQDAPRAARRILEWVYNHMEGIERNVTFKSALEVLDTMEGTCSEYTVLFMALARAAGIPARGCVGLLPISGTDLGLHMWAQVYLDGWMDVDPSWNQMPADATHIKVAQGDISLNEMLRLNVPLHRVRTQLDTVRVIRYRIGTEEVLARAEELFEQAAQADRSFDESGALKLFQDVTELPPNARTDDALLRIAQLHLHQDDQENAVRALRRLLAEHPESEAADDALFEQAKLQERRSEPDSAVLTLAALVDRFPQSELADDALCRMAEIYERDLDHLPAAKAAYRKVVEGYPEGGWAIIAEEALKRMEQRQEKGD